MNCPECGKKMKKLRKDYHYTESGLDNVYLTGIDIYSCACGEEMPLIPDMPGLHKVIAYTIARSNLSLNGSMFRFLRKALKLTQAEIARIMGVNKITISRWETGAESIGPANEKVIRLVYLQTLQEECDRVFMHSVEKVTSIRRVSRTSSRINVPPHAWEKLCGQNAHCPA